MRSFVLFYKEAFVDEERNLDLVIGLWMESCLKSKA